MWPFKKKSSEIATLREKASGVQDMIAEAFDDPGPLCNEGQRQLREAWLQNFARNLAAAVTALETGIDMRGSPISKDQTCHSLRGMCDTFGKEESLKRLELVCGPKIRKRFERILQDVRSAAS